MRSRHFNVWVASTSLTDADVVLGEGRQIVFVDSRDVPTLDLAESTRHFVLSFLDSPQYAALAGTARERACRGGNASAVR